MKGFSIFLCLFPLLAFGSVPSEDQPYHHSIRHVPSIHRSIDRLLRQGYVVINPERSPFDGEKCVVRNGPPLTSEKGGCAYLKYLFDTALLQQYFLAIKLEGKDLRVTDENVADLYDTVFVKGRHSYQYTAAHLKVDKVASLSRFALIYGPHGTVISFIQEQAVGAVTEFLASVLKKRPDSLIKIELGLNLAGEPLGIDLANWETVLTVFHEE